MNMTENIEKLVRLAKENPNLPIIAMVHYDIVGDDGYCRWLGQFGYVKVGEYALYGDRHFDDREEFKERYYNNNDEELSKKFNYDPRINEFTVGIGSCTQEALGENSQREKELEKYLDEVADKMFKRAIIVNIDLPDDLLMEEK